MHKLIVCLLCALTLAVAAGNVVAADRVQRSDIVPVEAIDLDQDVQCVRTGPSSTPPWLNLDPPWDPNIQIPDVYNRDDQILSMAYGPDGKVYVAYDAISNAAPLRYATGIAWSTDNGVTWNNMVYYSGTYSVFGHEISVTDDGKIYIWGTLTGGAYTNIPSLARSRAGYYNRPDTLSAWKAYNIPARFYPECVSWGLGNQFILAQYTVDRTGANDSMCVLWSGDSTASGTTFYFNVRPPLGNPEKTSVSVDVIGTDTILTHAIECLDATNGDWDVICYLDTINGSGYFYGWATGNTLDDRYPSVFASQGMAYIALQSDFGGGDQEILFTYSLDYGQTWDLSLQDISNDGAPDLFPRVYGFSTSVGCAWIHGLNQTFFDYSILSGTPGSWTGVPEIVTDNASVDTGYHCVALVYTPSYYHATWQDSRNFGTDGLEMYTSRRTTPIGIVENKQKKDYTLLNVYPNPFTGATAITCGNTATMKSAKLAIYNIAGRLVRTLSIPSGRTAACVTWDGRSDDGRKVNAGVYFCRFESNGSLRTEKLIRLK